MSIGQFELGADLEAQLRQANKSVPPALLELNVTELYRRGAISGGKVPQLLGMSRLAFHRHAADLGIPYFNLDRDQWEAERAFLNTP